MNNIERTLIWFENESGIIQELTSDYFGLSTLLNRLLNESYVGKKIKFINIYLATEEKYLKFPAIPSNYTHYYGGHINHYGVFDDVVFNRLNKNEQREYVWKKANQYLNDMANSIKNIELVNANKYAYEKGIKLHLNTDFRVVERLLDFSGTQINASIWIIFAEEKMISKLILDKEGLVIFEKEIGSAPNGMEFFLEMYKSIELKGDTIIIKGHRNAEDLPLRIPIQNIALPKETD